MHVVAKVVAGDSAGRADARVGETAGRSAWQLHASDWAEIGTLRAGDAFPDALAAAGKALETMLASNARSRSDAFQLPRRKEKGVAGCPDPSN